MMITSNSLQFFSEKLLSDQSSVVRGVREGRGGKDGRGVQLPDSLMDEAVLQSVGPGLETPQSPP